MNMKKFFYLFLLMLGAAFVSACSDDDDKDETIKIAKDQKSLTTYADGTGRTINFTAANVWSTTINYTKPSAKKTNNWITLDPPNGNAGKISLKINLQINYSGEARQAEIIIQCGGMNTTITVEQDAKTEDGKVPVKEEDPTVPSKYKKLISKIVMNSEDEEDGNSEITFEYDSQNRLISMSSISKGEDSYSSKEVITYSDNTISFSSTWTNEEGTSEEKSTYILNQDGNVETWKQEEEDEISEGKITYDENGYFLSSETWDNESQIKFAERAEWHNGNLIKAIGSQDNYSQIEYGELLNNANLDFIYMFCQTEWLTCLAFNGSGIKPLGYFGKRSANLPIKESDPEESTYSLYNYETNSEGYVIKVTVTDYNNTSNEVEYTTVYTISYIDAQ